MITTGYKGWLVTAGAMAFAAALWCPKTRAFVSETEPELFGTGDFDGNGKTDVVILDRPSGKYRLGYQSPMAPPAWPLASFWTPRKTRSLSPPLRITCSPLRMRQTRQ